MTNDRVMIDTNILVYAFLDTAPFHQEARSALHHLEEQGLQMWISRQIIREYIGTLTRPQTFADPTSIDEIIDQVHSMLDDFDVADDTDEVTVNLLNLLREYPTGGKQVHDANIVATMLTYGIGSLLTGNIGDLKRFEDRITLIPLIGDA